MRRLLLLLVAFMPAGLLHAQVPSVLDGVRLLDPGLQMTLVAHPPVSSCYPNAYESWLCDSPYYQGNKLSIGVDAAGNHYSISAEFSVQETNQATRYFVLQRLDSFGTLTDLAYLYNHRCRNGIPCGFQDEFLYRMVPHVDITNGRILVGVRATYLGSNEQDIGVLAIGGLPTLFDTLLTFIPGQQAMNILTPAHPDGFRAADSLQVWTGNVRSMPDWSQAQPLNCEAAVNPAPGQLVSVADTLPDPAIGEGRYYLVASQSGPDRRLGRQYVNGAFSAREPAGLPGCQ